MTQKTLQPTTTWVTSANNLLDHFQVLSTWRVSFSTSIHSPLASFVSADNQYLISRELCCLVWIRVFLSPSASCRCTGTCGVCCCYNVSNVLGCVFSSEVVVKGSCVVGWWLKVIVISVEHTWRVNGLAQASLLTTPTSPMHSLKSMQPSGSYTGGRHLKNILE